MHCLITHDDAEWLAFLSLVIYLHILCIRAANALASLTTYMHRLTWAFIAKHCDKYQNQNGCIPLICSFVTSKSILFDLNYAKVSIRVQFCINDKVHIWHAKYQLDIICNKIPL